jgi:hypothetical protein
MLDGIRVELRDGDRFGHAASGLKSNAVKARGSVRGIVHKIEKLHVAARSFWTATALGTRAIGCRHPTATTRALWIWFPCLERQKTDLACSMMYLARITRPAARWERLT